MTNLVDYQNDTIKSIMERRSIRKYKPKQISKAELDCIITCGLNAPSAVNSQNWHFTVIQKADVISWMNDRIKANLSPDWIARNKDRQGGREDFSLFYFAPTVVLISGEAKDSWMESNCAYAVENMCLAAQSIGVASIIIGLVRFLFSGSDGDANAKKLGVPEGYKPLYAVCFGYGDMNPEPPARIPGRVTYMQ